MYLLVQIATALACTIFDYLWLIRKFVLPLWLFRFARPVVVWLRAVVAGALADDLESQLKDLQEVNETTVNNLIHTEKQLEQVRRDYDALRQSRDAPVRGGGGGGSSEYLRRETEQLRDDLRSLRDKNHQLVQDNIKLTEHLQDLEIQNGHPSSTGAC